MLIMSNTIVACPPVRIRLRQLPLDSSGIEQRGAEGDRVESRLIEPEKSNEEPKATELRAGWYGTETQAVTPYGTVTPRIERCKL